ncbi:hypothetical protein ACP4OV_010940 [Aristida adscensionis]
MLRRVLRRLSTAAEKPSTAASASARPSPSPLQRRPRSGDLYLRIAEVGSPRLPLAPVLEQWAREGHTVGKQEIQRIVKRLTVLRRYTHALELSFWMTDRRHLHLTPGDVACRLELIGKVHGVEKAVEYFNSTAKQLRKHQCYGSLLKCYVEAKAAGEAEELYAKMQGMGMKTAFAYNMMMKLCLETRQIDRVHALFREMEENGVEPDMFSVENLLAAYRAVDDVNGIAKLLEKANPRERLLSWHAHASAAKDFMKAGMQDRAFQALMDAEKRIIPRENGRVAYGFLLNTYYDLGMYSEVERIWAVYKSKVQPLNSMYMCRISLLLKMNNLEGAEEAFKEWERKGAFHYDFRIVNLMVDAYCREGLVEKAVALVDDAIKKGRKPYANTWYKIAGGYFKNGEVLKAVDLTRKALVSGSDVWKPDLTYVLMSLNYFMDQKDVQAAEEMASMLQKLVPLTRDVYHCLLKTYARAGMPVSDLLDRMKKDGIEADEETNRILAGEWQ